MATLSRRGQGRSVVAPPGRPPAVAELAGVSVDIGRSPVLDAVSFRAGPGEVIGVTGPNGSGKSTLLETLATLRRPRLGSVSLFGEPVERPVPAGVRRRICLVAHQPALYPQLTVRENLRLVAALYGRSEASADESLTLVGLHRAAERRVEQCSVGMVRRADLARSVIVDPTLLLLDEAHAGLDHSAVELIDHLVAGVRERGGAAVLVAHDWRRLDHLTHRMVEVDRGRLLSSSPGAVS